MMETARKRGVTEGAAREDMAGDETQGMAGGSWQKRLDIRRLKIKSRKDWVIFWAFAALIAYIAGGAFDRKVNTWLCGIHTPWLSALNEPQNYGRAIIAAVFLTVMAEGVLLLCRKSLKAKLLTLAAGALLSLAMIGGYQVHCRLIVSVLWNEEPQNMFVKTDGSYRYRERGGEEDLTDAQWEELLELCRSLAPVTDPEEQQACMAWYEAEGDFVGSDGIHLHFPEEYGHRYMLQLNVQDGYIYLWRGYQGYTQLITFFEDNGIIEWLQNIKQDKG